MGGRIVGSHAGRPPVLPGQVHGKRPGTPDDSANWAGSRA